MHQGEKICTRKFFSILNQGIIYSYYEKHQAPKKSSSKTKIIPTEETLKSQRQT